jgi:hypothetical protein
LDLLPAIGHLRNWTNWIFTILSTFSTKVLLGGSPGHRICHGQGLNQGDPLSPMLFVLVIECFSVLITTAEARGLFLLPGTSAIKHRISLYADDVVMYVSPIETDLVLIRSILDLFFRATGLVVNFVKSQEFPIRCDTRHTDLISELLGCVVASFPCTYLGVPSRWGDCRGRQCSR